MSLFDRDGVSVSRQDNGVLTLLLNRGAFLIEPISIALLSDALAVVEKAAHPKVLVIIGSGKFFCNGLDVTWMQKNPKSSGEMVASFWRVLSRLMIMDCHTVCAINGHAFGAGLFMALACDWRIMRTEKGFLNWPEVNLGMSLSVAFAELSKAKMSPAVLQVGVLTGKRFSSSEALAAGIIHKECDQEDLATQAAKLATSYLPTNLGLVNFDPAAFQRMKIELYTDACRALNGLPLDAPVSAVPLSKL